LVANKKLKVFWTDKAVRSLEKHCNHIKEESAQSATKVKSEIFKTTKSLPNHPRKYQIDEYYPKGSAEIRRFFKWDYRVVYEIREDTIDILNVIHTSQEPSTK
jgi:plasmid stabilization system protein ParE